jgi:hypothetical protein
MSVCSCGQLTIGGYCNCCGFSGRRSSSSRSTNIFPLGVLLVDYSKQLNPVRFRVIKHVSYSGVKKYSISNAKDLIVLLPGEKKIDGIECYKRLEISASPLLDVRFLEELWERKKLIPEGWKDGMRRYFWGTILGGAEVRQQYVAYLVWDDSRKNQCDKWYWGYSWINDDFDSRMPAVCLEADP